MQLDDRQQYYVAVKILLRKDDTILLIKDKFNDGWDLPGGRMLKSEFGAPPEDTLKRKVTEEIGSQINYKLGEIKTTFQQERTEEGENEKPTIRIFAVGYEAEYISGEIIIGEYIQEYCWININKITGSKLLTGGWRKGMETYMQALNIQSRS